MQTLDKRIQPTEDVDSIRSRDVEGKWRLDPTLIWLCLTALVVRLAFALIVPHGDAPDEPHHLWVIQFISEHWRLPNPADVRAAGVYGVYGAMPQLGYTPQILLARIFAGEHLLFAARCGSVLTGVATVWLGFFAGKEIFGSRSMLARALPWTMVFHPQFAFLYSYCNNDSLAAALSALTIYLTVLNLKRGLTLPRCATLGAVAGLTLLCKFNALVLFPVVLVSVIAAAWLHCASLALCLACLMLFAANVAVASAWWFWRNYQLYGIDDLLGVKSGYQTFATAFHQPLHYREPVADVLSSKRWWRFLFFSFWGLFGHMTRWLWRPLYFVYIGFAIASVVGWVRAKLTVASDRSQLITPAIWLTLALCFALNFAAIAFSQLGGPQGRYLFISEIPILALTLEGLSRIGGRKGGTRTVIAFVAFNALVCLGSLVMLLRTYGVTAHLL